MKIVSFSLSLVSIALLTACGGGGNSSGGNANTVTPVINNVKGSVITLTNNVATTTTTANSNDINQLVVNGNTIEIIPSNFSSGQTIDMRNITNNGSKMTRIGSVNSLASSRYGYLKDGDNGTPYLFSHGKPSTNTPTAGIANYAGSAVNVATNADKKGTTITTPTAYFSVDFGAKTVNGVINNTNQLDLYGKISGNQFTGTTGGVTTNGYFYGDKATELGGTYHNANGTVSGAYGAKKQ